MENKFMIDEDYLERIALEENIDIMQVLIEEAKKPKEVNSDEDPTADKMDTGQAPARPGLSDEELQQIIQGIQQGQIQEDQIQQMQQSGQLTDEDIQKIQEGMQQMQQQQPSPEEQAQMETTAQINQLQEMTIRFNIYDKLIKLEDKLDYFLNYFHDITNPIYPEIENIKEYISVINSLVFNLEINLLYELYAKLEMKIIDLFEQYLMEKNNEVKG